MVVYRAVKPWWRSINTEKTRQASNSSGGKASAGERTKATSTAKHSLKAGTTIAAKHSPEQRPRWPNIYRRRTVEIKYPLQKPNNNDKAIIKNCNGKESAQREPTTLEAKHPPENINVMSVAKYPPKKRQRKRQSICRRSDHIVWQTQALKNMKRAQAHNK
jgi:hypothetical protein